MSNLTRAEETARYIFSLGREFLIFWAVLFFTAVAGIITLLPEIKPAYGRRYMIPISLLYFVLVGLMVISVQSCFRIVEWGNELIYNKSLGQDTLIYAQGHRTWIDIVFLDDNGKLITWREWIVYIGIFVFFATLIFMKVTRGQKPQVAQQPQHPTAPIQTSATRQDESKSSTGPYRLEISVETPKYVRIDQVFTTRYLIRNISEVDFPRGQFAWIMSWPQLTGYIVQHPLIIPRLARNQSHSIEYQDRSLVADFIVHNRIQLNIKIVH